MRYFYFFLLCAFSNVTTTQEYRPMLQDGARWNEYISIFPECNFTLKIIGDTILNNLRYKKIGEDPYCGFYADRNHFRFLREDTLERKVYETFSEDSAEYLLYDFNFLPGDTFYHDREQFVILDSITDVLSNPFFCGTPENNIPNINIEDLRVFYWKDASFPIVWIEGIGSLAGLLSPIHTWGGGFPSKTVLCHFDKNGEKDFHYVYCEEPVLCRAIGENVVANKKISDNSLLNVYPNPSQEYLFLDFSQTTSYKEFTCNFYSINGHLLKSITTNSNQKIPLNFISSGIYFLEIILDKQQRFTHKFIKQ